MGTRTMTATYPLNRSGKSRLGGESDRGQQLWRVDGLPRGSGHAYAPGRGEGGRVHRLKKPSRNGSLAPWSVRYGLA